MTENHTIGTWLNEGIALQRAGQLAEAEKCYRLILQHEPQNAAASHALGLACYQQHKITEAVDYLQHAVSLQPGAYPAFNNLGIALKAAGRIDDAIAAFHTAIELNPKYAEARFNLGLALNTAGKPLDAINSYRQVLLIKPDFAASHTALGNLLRTQGEFEDAFNHLQTSLKLTPGDAEAELDVALVLTDLGRYTEAIYAAQAAIKIDSNNHRYWESLGSAQRLAGYNEDAIISLQQAIALSPDNADLLFDLGVAQIAVGDMHAGQQTLNKVAVLKPDWLKVNFERDLALPPLYDSDQEMAEYREQWSAGLSQIEARIYAAASDDLPQNFQAVEALKAYTPFFLHYQNVDNTELQLRYGKVVETIAGRAFPAFSNAVAWVPLAHGRRLRVGFVSGYFRTHSVAHFFARWVTELDANNFEVFVWSTGDIADSVTAEIESATEHYRRASSDNLQLITEIHGAQLDALIYLDVGIDPRQQLLAALRLAPIQCAAYGHPVTTGLKNIDYFLGSDNAEPENAAAHYSEKLIRLPRLAVNYPCPRVDDIQMPEAMRELGERPVLLCAQRMFKILPEFDRLAAKIASQVPGCTLAFFNAMNQRTNQQFIRRIGRALAAEGLSADQTLTLLPVMRYSEFLGAVRRANVVLDTTYFSGGNSSFDVLAMNTPIVTYNAPMMRGRQTAAMLKLLDVAELVANTHEEYLTIAIELANNNSKQAKLRKTIEAMRGNLFDDIGAVPALAATLMELAQFANRRQNGPNSQ